MKNIVIVLMLFSALFAQDITVSTLSDKQFYSSGDTVTLALVVEIPEGHHLYANPLGPGAGKAFTVTPKANHAINWVDGFSDKAHKYQQDETNWVWQWDDSVHIFIRGIVTSAALETTNLSIEYSGLICKTACIPQNGVVNHTITHGKSLSTTPFAENETVSELYKSAVAFPIQQAVSIEKAIETRVAPSQDEILPWNYSPREASDINTKSSESKPLNLGMAIFLAFIAGVILNFMPCVLPVLGIKILSFSEGRTGSKATAMKNSFAFAAGMVLVFLLLGALAAFAGMSWGEQFQNPIFTIVLIAMMFVFGLGMFDLFIILVPNKISEMDMKQDSHSLVGNFGKGVFATLLATPCSGPFLGATLAWTVTQPKPVVFAVFLALGIGMASPYILLAASERLSRIIPKPGAWMEDFKHILGFFLFGFAVYLMIGLPAELVLPTVSFLVILTGAIMVYGRIAPFGVSLFKKVKAAIVVVLLLWGGFHVSFVLLREMVTPLETEGHWQKFTPELLENAHADGQHVLLDFTALWCMNCQFNKKNVYHTETMDSLIEAKNILSLKADLTKDNEQLERLRSHLGSESIPFLVLFPSDNPEEPIIFRDIVSREQVFSILRELSE